MSLSDTIRWSHQGDGVTASNGSDQETGNSRVLATVDVPANTTNQQVTGAWTNSAVQSIWIMATQNMTLKSNSATAPGNTINLKAGIPLQWSISPGYFANPFTADVTTLYVSSATGGKLTIRILTS